MKEVSPAELSVFLAIAKHRSFARAAVELGVTSSALSHKLRTIEERVGLRLINRTTRSVALTEAGQRLLARVEPAFRELRDAIEDLNALRGTPVGTMRINAPHHASRSVLLPIIARFLAAHPGVRVEVAVDDAFVDVVAAGFDAGVRYGGTIAADMIAIPIGPPQRFAVVASPQHFERHPIPVEPSELQGQPCIRLRLLSGALHPWRFERGGDAVEVPVDGPLTVTDDDLMVEAALAGLGVAHVFEELVSDLVASGRLVRVLSDWCPAYPGAFLYYPSRRQLPAALKAFVDFARAAGDPASRRRRSGS